MSNFFWSYRAPGLVPRHSPPWRPTILSHQLALSGDVALGPLVADERQAHRLEVEVAPAGEVGGERLRLEPVERRVRLLGREGERGLVGVGHARHRRRRLARGDVAHRCEALGPGREQVAEDRAPLRQAVNVDGRLGDDPEAALAAQHHLADAGTGGGARHRARGHHPRRCDHPNGAGQVGDVAVEIRLHPRRARGDPAAERRVGEAVRKVAEGPAASVELLLEVRPRGHRSARGRVATRRRWPAPGRAGPGRPR